MAKMTDQIAEFCIKKGINGTLIPSYFDALSKRFGTDWKAVILANSGESRFISGGFYSEEVEKIVGAICETIKSNYHVYLVGNSNSEKLFGTELDEEQLVELNESNNIQLFRGNKLCLSSNKATRILPSIPGVSNSVHDLAHLLSEGFSNWNNVLIKVAPDPFAIQEKSEFQ